MNANNIYVGNRYTPLFCGPWEEGTEYESLSAVTYTDGNAYVSKKPVPAGTLPTDPDYWVLWGSGNAALDSVTQRLNTVENDVENLENSVAQVKEDMPWKVSTTLKGDGKTDNTLLFGALDPDTPIALTPGTYLITGNVTIPCAIQFIPGAVIKYNAATPGTNYATVTFAKGFYVPENTQIFDTYIIPKIGGNNASINPQFSWFGGKASNDYTTNSSILVWLLSGIYNAKEITIEPGTYVFSNLDNTNGIMAGDHQKIINAYGVTNARGATFPHNTTIKGLESGGDSYLSNANSGVTFQDCILHGSMRDDYGAIYKHCTIDGTINLTDGGTFIECVFNSNQAPIGATDSDKIITFKHCKFQLGASLTGNIINVGNNAIVLFDGNTVTHAGNVLAPNYKVTIERGFAYSNNLETGELTCNVAIGNTCYSLTAETHFGNVINGVPETAESVEQLSKEVEELKQQASGFNGTLALLLKRDYPSNISKSGNFLTIQFNSGLQFVFFKLEISDVSLGTAIGSMYRNASSLFDPSDYGYPIPFYEDPMYTGLVFDSTNYQGALPVSDTDAGDRKSNVPGVQLLAPTSRTVSGYIEILTVGLYKSMPLG